MTENIYAKEYHFEIKSVYRVLFTSLMFQVPDSLRVSDLSLSSGSLPVIQTPDIKRGLDMFLPWLHPDQKKPFLLVGPEGCGKE